MPNQLTVVPAPEPGQLDDDLRDAAIAWAIPSPAACERAPAGPRYGRQHWPTRASTCGSWRRSWTASEPASRQALRKRPAGYGWPGAALCGGSYQTLPQPGVRQETRRCPVTAVGQSIHGSHETVIVPGFQTWPAWQVSGYRHQSGRRTSTH
jgi:hypothetical protein